MFACVCMCVCACLRACRCVCVCAKLLTALKFNHAPPQPSHHSPLSFDPFLFPALSHVSPLLCSSSTLPHLDTNIHPSKQTSSCLYNFHSTLTARTYSSFFSHRYTPSLCGYPTQPRSHLPLKPPHLHP